jgi:peptidoglycan/LPS O-acetylase OafA/YrhL
MPGEDIGQVLMTTNQRPSVLGARPIDLPGLTGLRGIAASTVMLSHLGFGNIAAPFRTLLWHNAAVDLFFVLSCFTLFHVYDRPDRPIDWRQFAVRRVARIYPLYLFLFVLAMAHNARFYRMHWAHFELDSLRQALLINCWPLIGNNVSWIVPSWSLSVEWLAYFVFFPVLFVVHRRWGAWLVWRPFLTLPLSLLASLGGFYVYTRLFQWGDLSIHADRLPILRQIAPASRVLLGFLSGYAIFLCDRGLRRRRGNAPASGPILRAAAPVTALLALAVLGFGAAGRLPIDVMIVVSPLLVLCAASSGNVISAALAVAPLIWLGDLSYSIYLVHYPVLIVTEEVLQLVFSVSHDWFITNPQILAPVMTAISVLLAIALHRWLELPVGSWIRARGRNLRRYPDKVLG